jgi:hypothetical protein
MTFEPKRCGSSLASATSYGDTPGIELIDAKAEASASDTSAGQIIPAYVKSDQAALVGFVRQYMSFLKPTTLNRMIKAIQKPQNKFFQSTLSRNFEHRRWFVHLFVERPMGKG